MRNSEYNELKPFLIRPTFLLFDLTGFLIVSLTFFIESGGVAQSLISIGSTIFTLGITLPIALYYQSKHNRESFKIIKSCEDAGILSIFVSRKDDDIDLKDAIEEAARTNSSEIFLLGIAFRSFFDPNVAHSSNIERVIENTTIKTRIMLLDPKSEAANRRAEIEKDGSTIDDINYTINHGIKSAVKRRIDNKIRNTPEIRELLDTYKGFDPTEKKQMDINQNLLESVNLELKLYKIDPIVFIMGFQECLFVEQYHFGRPEFFVIPGSCIGKHVPVIQYRKNCKGYAFFKSHFDFMWKNGEDITMKIIQSSLA